jgi:hypothetical protein
MSYECPLCKLQPFSHSLTKLSEKKGIIYYYTCPSQATLYYDAKSIIDVAVELAKLISNKFSKNLKKIIIINPTFYIKITHKILIPFLNEKVKNIIEMNYENNKPEEIIL